MIIFSLFYYIYCYFYYHDNPVVENHAFFDTYYFNNPVHPLFESLGYTPFIKKENKVFIIKEATDREKWSVYANTKNIENYDFLFTIGEQPYKIDYEEKQLQPKILGATKKNENIELYVVPIKQLYSGEYNKKKMGENFFIYHIKNYHSVSLNKISKKGSKTREDFLSVNATILQSS